MFTRKIIASAAGLFLVAGGVTTAMTANAADGGACSVSGTVTVTPGPASLTAAAGSTDVFNFSSTTISCQGTAALAGDWTGVTATGTADSNVSGHETCGEGAGAGNLTGGTNSVTSDSITGTSGKSAFTFKRVGALVTVKGVIDTTAGQHATFVAVLTFQPTHGGCTIPPDGNSDKTVASMNGAAVIENAA